jgi:hypothetical protein
MVISAGSHKVSPGEDELTNDDVAFSYFYITPLNLLVDTLLLRAKSLHLWGDVS